MQIPMTRAYNFSAGPATLPEPVLRQAQDEMLEWRDARASVVEISHRGAEFMQMAAETEADLRALLSIPADYAVLFVAGGATVQQALMPLNFAAPGKTVDYVVTGHWGRTAMKQAKAASRPHTRAGTLAKRFAAKEAFSKAVGTGFKRGVYMKDIGVVNLASGAPTLQLTGGARARVDALAPEGHAIDIHLTMTDDHPWAQAFVILTARKLEP